MELDELKRRWDVQDRKLDANIRLNTRMLRESVLGRAETSLGRLYRLLWLELMMSLLATILLGAFLAKHVSEPRFLIPAAVLHLCAIGLLVSGVRQMVALKAVDYSAPIVVIQKRLESLRAERIRAVMLTFLIAPLLWTPLMIVTLKGLIGFDAYALGAAYLIANLVFGLLFILLALWISKRYEARMKSSPVVQSVMRDLAGKSLASAAGFVRSISEFEKDEPAPIP